MRVEDEIVIMERGCWVENYGQGLSERWVVKNKKEKKFKTHVNNTIVLVLYSSLRLGFGKR